jgi:hypothetical protein
LCRYAPGVNDTVKTMFGDAATGVKPVSADALPTVGLCNKCESSRPIA